MSENEKIESRRIAEPIAQQSLMLPAKHGEIDGLEMGVLEDGTPYLTSRALARLCDVARSSVTDMTRDWAEHSLKPRGLKIREILKSHGHPGDILASQVDVNGVAYNAHPDAVCMSILEYYAFEVGREKAKLAYRILARETLRRFIYQRVGYMDPTERAWQNFRAIAEENQPPRGYFSIFKESSDLILTSIRHGLPLSPHTIPDISIGQVWGRFWSKGDFDEKFSDRRKYPHHYPANYPQAEAYPEAWVYPNAALGDFRDWFENIYLPDKYPAYLRRKIKNGELDVNEMQKLLTAIRIDRQLEE